MTTLLPLLRRIVRRRWFLVTLGVHLMGMSSSLWEVLARAEDAPPATQAAPAVSYFRDVLPILQAHCHGCHQPAKREGEYVMTDVASLLRGGESGEPAVVPGNPSASGLWNQIRVDQGTPAMPKGRSPLSAPHLKQIEAWIAAGAVDDSPPATRSRYDAEHPPEYAAPPVITALDYSPDGQWLAISGYHEVLLYRPEQGLEGRLIGLSERIESAVFSPDGRQLAVTGGSPGRLGEIQMWRVEQRELAWSQTVGYDTLYGASWSRDGKRIALGCPDKTTRALDAETGQQVFFNGAHEDWVLDTVFSLEGDHLVTVSRDMSMKLMHVATQRFIDNITSITPGALKGGLMAVDRHPARDEVLVGGADGIPKIYRMHREKARVIGDDFNLIRALPAMPGRLFDVAYSRDGKYVVAGSSFQGRGEIRAFVEADGRELWKIEVPDGGIYAVAVHPQGTTVAAGGFDGLVRIVDFASGTVSRSFYPVEWRTGDAGGQDGS